MAVSYVDGAIMNEAAPTTTGTITIPATVQTGDDLYVSITSRGHVLATPLCSVTDDDAGGNTWTFEGSDDVRKGQLFWKKATSATASKTITISGAVTSVCSVVAVYRGGAAGDPTTDFGFEANVSPDKSHATFTPTNADSMVCISVCDQSNNVSVTAVVATTPASLTSRVEQTNAAGTGSAVSHASAAQSGGPSATGTISWTMTNSSTKSLAWAIKPFVAVVPPSTNATQWGQPAASTATRVFTPRVRGDDLVENGHAVNTDPYTDTSEG